MTTPKSGLTRIILTAAKAAPPKTETHAERVARATKELTEAETLLKGPGKTPKRFLATFRLKDAPSAAKGTYAQRREHLIARFKALSGVEHHVSTSAWSLRSYHETAQLVLAALKPAIDESMDFLQVEQTAAPVSAGVAKLKS